MGNKIETMNAIAEAARKLIEESGGELPTARQISKATGYSAGTVYLHFGAIGGLVRYLVKARVVSLHNSIDALINAHDPKAHPGALLDQILDRLFTQISQRNPTIMRKMYQIAIDNADHPLEFDQAADSLFSKLLLAIARDETGIFKQLSLEEISLVTRGLRGLVISPLMEKNRVFGTSTHMEIAKSYLRKMFLNEG